MYSLQSNSLKGKEQTGKEQTTNPGDHVQKTKPRDGTHRNNARLPLLRYDQPNIIAKPIPRTMAATPMRAIKASRDRAAPLSDSIAHAKQALFCAKALSQTVVFISPVINSPLLRPSLGNNRYCREEWLVRAAVVAYSGPLSRLSYRWPRSCTGSMAAPFSYVRLWTLWKPQLPLPVSK